MHSKREVRTKPFQAHASTMCPSHGELAASIAYELGELDPDRFERDLTALAAALPAEPDPEAQLCALGEIVRLTEHDGGLLTWFYAEGLTPGARIEVRDIQPSAGHRTIRMPEAGNGDHFVADQAAKGLFVRREKRPGES